MNELITYLEGGDLRSIAQVDKIVLLVKSQSDFDNLFEYLFSKDRLEVMRAADAVEKITINHPEFLEIHKKEIIEFLETAEDKEFKWHLAQLTPRLDLAKVELEKVWTVLSNWTENKKESKIVRVNSLQALHDLSKQQRHLEADFGQIVRGLKKENIPSIKARIRKLD